MKLHEESSYLQLLHTAMQSPVETDRTGVGTSSVYGATLKFDLDPFPIIRGKKVLLGPLFTEIQWFIQGRTDVEYLVRRGCNIWTEWALVKHRAALEELFGGSVTIKDYKAGILSGKVPMELTELGPVYGAQWRNFNGVDQIANLVDGLINNPRSRRHIVNSWNVPQLPDMALPPCHLLYQFHVGPALHSYSDPQQRRRAHDSGKALHLTMYQRSADLFLGIPFNITSYAALAHWVSEMTGYAVGTLTMFLGDAHVYSNHHEAVAAYTGSLQRVAGEPQHRLVVEGGWCPEFRVEGYEPGPFIPAPVAV